jgi:PAS domain S-box-containing protein
MISFDNCAGVIEPANPPLALIVDDDGYIRRLLRAVLERDGLRVAEVVDGEEAVEAAVRLRPDIILLDIMMKGVDGITVCRHLRAAPSQAAVPIAMITAVRDDDVIDAAYAAGATDFILKPPNLTFMRQRVRTLLRARQAEAALRASEARARAVVEAVGDPLLILDPDNHICHWNLAAERLFGYTAAEIRGQSVDILHPDAGASSELAEAAFFSARSAPGHDAFSLGELTLRRRDGSAVPMEISLSNFTIDGKQFRACLARDLTERKQMQARMLMGQKLSDLGTLAAGVAHEINSPLQVITGASHGLLRRLDEDKMDCMDAALLRRKLDQIHRSGWRCAEIIRALLTYAHPSNPEGTEANERAVYDLRTLVQDTLLLTEHQFESWSNIIIETDLADDLPPLSCDRNQITQMLINLLTNARDAMPAGGRISIRTCLAPQPGKLLLSVADTGGGISEAIQPRIFDPFFTTKPLGQGTGLGLSLVAGIVQAHGGEIQLESVPGRGTTFNITLPLDGAQPEPGPPVSIGMPGLVATSVDAYRVGRFDKDNP